MRKITSTVSLLFISISLATHAAASDIEQLTQKRGQVDDLVESILSSAIVVEYDLTTRTYFRADSPDVEILSVEGDLVEFEYRGRGATRTTNRETGEMGFVARSGTRSTDEETGIELLETEGTQTYRFHELGGDYVRELIGPDGGVSQRVIKRGDEYKALDIMSGTGQVLMEHGGNMAAMMARGPSSFRPSFYAQGIQQPYHRMNSPAGPDAFSIREDGDALILEERAPAPDGAQGPVAQTWEVLDDGLLIRRQLGGPGMPMRTIYDGMQSFMGFPFPETIERADYHPDGIPRARYLITSIRLSEGDAEAFEAEMEAHFGQ